MWTLKRILNLRFPRSTLLADATYSERGDELKCHRHDFGHFVLFLVLTMLKNAFYLSNVPLDQQFVFFFTERNKICGTQKQKLCIYHSLVEIEISLCSTQLYTVSSILLSSTYFNFHQANLFRSSLTVINQMK